MATLRNAGQGALAEPRARCLSHVCKKQENQTVLVVESGSAEAICPRQGGEVELTGWWGGMKKGMKRI